jgi:sugar diacid utilization regulator
MVDDCDACGLPASPAGAGMVLVVPEHRADHADRKLAQMAAMSGNRMWTATATRPMTEVTSAYQEAKDILALVLAARRPPGHYRLDDVLVEYAIARDPVVSRRLVAIVQPLLAGKVLLETLEALIAAGFDRGTTARTLFIHRSTLDYRIRRIAELTGHCPATSRGAHLLTAAMTAHNVDTGLFWFDEKMPGKVMGNR